MNDSLFQSTIVHISHKSKKTHLQHYSIPHHDAQQLYKAYHELLEHQHNKDKVLDLLEKAGITHITKFYDGPCKYEGLHIPGPGLCWRNAVHSSSSSFLNNHHTMINNNINNKVVLIETTYHLEPIHWYFIDLKESMTSSAACAALIIDKMVHNHSNSPPSSSESASPSESESSQSSSSNHTFSFYSFLQKSKKSLFYHNHDTLVFIIGCPLPIRTNESNHITYLG